MRPTLLVLLSALVATVIGCERAPAPSTSRERKGGVDGTPPGKGKRLAAGQVRDVRLTPDGRYAVYLQDARKPAIEGLAPQTAVGDLYAVALAGGAPHRVGAGVTNLPGGYLFTPDSHYLLFRTAYEVTLQSGQLEAVRLADANPEPSQVLGKLVTSFAVSPDSKQIAWVEGGVLKRRELGGGAPSEVSGEVALAEFAPSGDRLFIRRTLAAGGGFLVAPAQGGSPPTKLADRVGDFRVSSDGKRVAFAQRSETTNGGYDLWVAEAPAFTPAQVARDVGAFAFSPDGHQLGRIEGHRPGVVGDLVVGPAEGGPGKKIAERPRDFVFAPDSTAVAYVDHYDETARSGRMGVAPLPTGSPKTLGGGIDNYEWGANGKSLAYIVKRMRPVPTVDLFVYSLGTDKPVLVGEGVFGYGFAPRNAYLLLRTHCTREGRACDLRRLDLTDLNKPQEQLVEGIYSFRPSADASRILLSYARFDSDAFDLAVYDVKTRGLQVLDRAVILPGFWAGTTADQVAYAVVDRSRAGLYVAPAGR